MPSWKDPLEPKRRQCWWLIDGKMCLKQLHYFMDRDVSYCDDQHETTGKEEKQRKTK